MTRLQEAQWVEEVTKPVTTPPAVKRWIQSRKLNLYRISWVHAWLESPWPQFLIRLITVIGMLFIFVTALLGTSVGSHNFAIIMVWIAWWTGLKLGFIPFGGRSWCSVCPIPLAGDWLQQGGILKGDGRKHGLNIRWPTSLRGFWLQSAGFLLIGLFSAVTLTDPRVTGWVLLALFVLAAVMSLVFDRRAFCSHICPVGGFSAIYSKAGPLEIRIVDKEVCIRHAEKSCYRACPWGLYPLAFKDSSACGVCLECLRACPKDNIALNLRPYGSDLLQPPRSGRLDEAFLALVMLSSALVFSAVFTGPWGWLKLAAYQVGSLNWMLYAASFLAFTVIILPAIFTLCLWLGEKYFHNGLSLRRLIGHYSQGLLPLGMLAWIAFTISFALPKLGLILTVLNDPFGWGWHLLSINNPTGLVDVSSFSPYLQILLLAIGVLWSSHLTNKLSKPAKNGRSLPHLPLLVFYLAYAMALLWILVG